MRLKLDYSQKIPLVFVFIALLFLLALAPSVYYFSKYRQAQQKLATVSANHVSALVSIVGKHILLPDEETPTVLTVTDKEKLSGQVFFAHASNGDKVLVYEKAKKAFLYDPDRDLVLEIGPVTFGTPSGTVNAGQTQSIVVTPIPQPLRFVLYNGTTTVGLTKTYETKLITRVPQAVVVDRDNASRQDYASTLLVDLSGKNASAASSIAQSLGITVAQLPQGESSASADFLIILGNDQ